MVSNTKDIARIFKTLIDNRLGILSIIDDQKDAPVPSPDLYPAYVSVKIISKVKEGHDAVIYTQSNEFNGLDETLAGRRRVVVSLNFYRNKQDYDKLAVDLAEEFKTYLSSHESILEFSKNRVGLINTSAVRDLSEIDVKTFEGRAVFEVELYISSELVTNVVEIEDVTIDGDIENTGLDEFPLNVSQ
jgi:cobalamin biosynthesis Co2+ chelatase CbiK